ncbi:MAG: universal stress protein [Bacteroidetes bacterium]|nr:universal stress protein [Bacteroidota bacterium]
MSYILAATDFSDVANNSLSFACQLGADLNLKVVVFHTFIIPVTFSDAPMPIMPLDEAKEIAEGRMAKIFDQFRKDHPKTILESKIMFGDLMDCIDEYAEKEAPMFVVLGNSGLGGAALWLGSNVLSALRHSDFMVLAIPPNFDYKKPEKLCFACDFKHIANHLNTDLFVKLIDYTHAQLHVLNIEKGQKDTTYDEMLEKSDLHLALRTLNPVYHYVEKENVEEGIEDFLNDHQMDWLIIVPHKYSFFENIFHKSRTKAIMQKVALPLLAIHEK